ncbi:polysaccharide deacetylase [Priestia endophytica]|uniref:polysaccharide deacetylase family protein n=1 Tax=Priestia endophytica TaxID=135735 RepID=UPI000DCA5484|nr:polysaccharide deacetylase family protein [Priestia endophytica]RAS91770.1 polysaccharide deacetylase [Priestia endophytica]
MKEERYITKKRKRRKIIKLGLLLTVAFLLFFFFGASMTSHITKGEENSEKSGTIIEQEKKAEKLLSTNSKKTDEKIVYLTFDDGPSAATDNILKILRNYHAKATFFMLEPHIREHPDLVKQMIKEGHGLGLHGVTHDVKHFYHSEETVLNEMNEDQKTLEEITGFHSDLIRPPYGSVPYLIDSFREKLDSKGYKLWDWTVDSNDWNLTNGEYVNSTIKQIKQVEQKGEPIIVLMHDKESTEEHLPKLLNWLTQEGYQTKKIDDSIKPYHFRCNDRCYRYSA